MTDLDKLIDAVEYGDINLSPFWKALPPEDPKCAAMAFRAYTAANGSLDAAKALHDALLPGWDLLITTYEDNSFEVSVSPLNSVKTHEGLSNMISRAWLLAILRAHRSQVHK